jgi:hypothetical protein
MGASGSLPDLPDSTQGRWGSWAVSDGLIAQVRVGVPVSSSCRNCRVIADTPRSSSSSGSVHWRLQLDLSAVEFSPSSVLCRQAHRNARYAPQLAQNHRSGQVRSGLLLGRSKKNHGLKMREGGEAGAEMARNSGSQLLLSSSHQVA